MHYTVNNAIRNYLKIKSTEQAKKKKIKNNIKFRNLNCINYKTNS